MTGTEEPGVPEDSKEKTDNDDVDAEDLTLTADRDHVPPCAPKNNEKSKDDQPKPFGYTDRILSVFAIAISALSAFFVLQQVEVTRDTAKKQLRAYVHAVPGPVYHIDGKGPLQSYVVIGNTGQTFAQKVERWIGMSILGATVPDKAEGLGIMEREEGVLVISPKAKHDVIKNGDKLTKEEINKIWAAPKERGSKRIYVFGKITYEDIYGESHRTDFCFMYFGYERNPLRLDSYLSGQGKYCDKYNYAD